jgi:hypothetical protein
MKKQRGSTMMETLMVAFLMGIVFTGAMNLIVGLGRSYDRTNTQLLADQGAARGIQSISQDLQEAKVVTVLSSTWIRIYFPIVTADGSYNRKVTDTTNFVEFYRGDKNGTRNASGNCLVRAPAAGGTRAVLTEGLYSLDFDNTNPSLVDIDLRVRKTLTGKTYECTMNHRAILMRNY